jgi:predicted nucleic acid-binding protein
MTIQAKVEATVVDIRYDRPRPTDKFLVDTNVWLWFTYADSYKDADARRLKTIQNYLAYLSKTKKTKAKMYWCGISLSEMSHSIEGIVRNTVLKGNPKGITTKEFRHNSPTERARIALEIETAWKLVENMGQSLDLLVSKSLTDSVITRHKNQQVDGYDYLLLEAMAKFGITNIITDDVDFVTVPGITVFTANFTALDLATRASKLLRRP